MNPVLLFPAGLAALAALAIPLLLHLARREENRPLDFAALRWLDQRPRPRSRIRFDEWLLLLLRLLLLALLALWFARPALIGGVDGGERVLVAPGARVAGLGPEARWLAPGFPPLDQSPRPGPLASLLRQADAEAPPGAWLTVITPAIIDGADAERPRLAHPVSWRITGGAIPSATIQAAPAPRLAIRAAPGRPTAVPAAVARAWRPGETPDLAATDAPLPRRDRILAWLAPGQLPVRVSDWIGQGGTALIAGDTVPPAGTAAVLWRDDAGTPVLEQLPLGSGRILRITRLLTVAALPAAAEPDFPQRLRALVAAPLTPTRAFARDYSPLAGGRRYPQPGLSLQPWLGLLIAILFLGERWLATAVRRSVMP